MNFYSKLLAVAGFAAMPMMALATPLSDYNLILFGDLAATGDVHVDGRTFVAGSISTSNSGVFASALQSSPEFSSTHNVEVAGNVGGATMTVQQGYLAYGGELTASNVVCNGVANCALDVGAAVLDAKASSMKAELTAESQYYLGLGSTAGTQITGDNNNRLLSYSGAATDLAVFNISGADVFSSTWNWNINLGNAQHFVINVSGADLVAKNNGVAETYADQLLWNFYEAEQVSFQGGHWVGSILALDAELHTKNNLRGAIAAQSYTGSGEVHHFNWGYTPPTTEVPEPSIMLLMLAGLGLIGLGRLRRRG